MLNSPKWAAVAASPSREEQGGGGGEEMRGKMHCLVPMSSMSHYFSVGWSPSTRGPLFFVFEFLEWEFNWIPVLLLLNLLKNLGLFSKTAKHHLTQTRPVCKLWRKISSHGAVFSIRIDDRCIVNSGVHDFCGATIAHDSVPWIDPSNPQCAFMVLYSVNNIDFHC